MMSTDYQLFLLASFAVIVIPGPNVMVIVATSLLQGRASGLRTVAGTSAAMLVQLSIAALGTGLLVSTLAQGLVWLKWLGVAYLVYLGLNSLAGAGRATIESAAAPRAFGRGFWISLTNPKTILFFSAFLPQFVSPADPYLPQVALLSLSFWGLAVTLDSCYALLAARLGDRFSHLARPRVVARLSGLVYLGAGALLASARQS